MLARSGASIGTIGAVRYGGRRRNDDCGGRDGAVLRPSWHIWRDRRGQISPLRIGTLALLLFPLAKALYDANAILHGARPINDLIHRAGFWALVFLGVTLAVTPLRRIARYR